MRFKHSWKIYWAASAILFSACSRVGPEPETPQIDLPKGWDQPDCVNSFPFENNALRDEKSQWWQAFQDPCLDQLIKRAIENNPDIFIALHRVDEYHFLVMESKANFLPQFYMGARYGNVETPKGSVLYQQQSLNTFLSSQNIKLNRHYEFVNIGPTLSWEIDVFGRLRSENLAKKADYYAAIENLKAVQLSISAEVARNYVLLQFAEKKLLQEKDYLSSLIARQEALKERLALQRATLDQIFEAEIHVLESNRRVIQYSTNIAKFKKRILTLLGETDWCLDDCVLSEITPRPQFAINIGVPSDLLIQRPDVAQADRELAAATYRIGKVMAEALPSFVLFGTIGGISKNIFELLSYKNLYWIFDPFITFPLYDAGASEAKVNEYSARANKAIANYHKTLLQAVEEVQIALYEVNGDEQELVQTRQLLNKTKDSFERKKLLYEKGLGDFYAIGLSEDELHQRQLDLLQSEENYALDFITLCKAVGGRI